MDRPLEDLEPGEIADLFFGAGTKIKALGPETRDEGAEAALASVRDVLALLDTIADKLVASNIITERQRGFRDLFVELQNEGAFRLRDVRPMRADFEQLVRLAGGEITEADLKLNAPKQQLFERCMSVVAGLRALFGFEEPGQDERTA